MTQSEWPCEPLDQDGPTPAQISALPQACTLTTQAISTRAAHLRKQFKPLITRREEISCGYVYWFKRTRDNMQMLADFALFESQCCSFLSFGIGLHPGGNQLSMRITGPAEASEFLRLMFADKPTARCCQ